MTREEKLSEEERKLANEQTHDSSLAAMVTRLPKYIAPLVNELFGEKFSQNAQVTIRNSKHIISFSDGSLR